MLFEDVEFILPPVCQYREESSSQSTDLNERVSVLFNSPALQERGNGDIKTQDLFNSQWSSDHNFLNLPIHHKLNTHCLTFSQSHTAVGEPNLFYDVPGQVRNIRSEDKKKSINLDHQKCFCLREARHYLFKLNISLQKMLRTFQAQYIGHKIFIFIIKKCNAE